MSVQTNETVIAKPSRQINKHVGDERLQVSGSRPRAIARGSRAGGRRSSMESDGVG